MASLAGIRFVLVHPEEGGNVGAAARALKNMGLDELVLVAPGLPDPDGARRMAHGAEDVLEAARCTGTLAAAIADCRWTVATTRRLGRRRAAGLSPRRLAALSRRQPERRPLAIVFGTERYGLTAADLDLCQDALAIPVMPAQPSLNLAQAVLIVAYELFLAHAGAPETVDSSDVALRPGEAPAGAAATAAEVEAQFEQLRAVLLAVGFASAETVDHRLRRLRRLLGRARPRADEITLLRGLWRQALWAARRPPDAAV
jgi:TrmH family RNA methyltransferase